MPEPTQPPPSDANGWWRSGHWGGSLTLSLACVLLLGLALRIRFALSTPQVFDEFNTVYAAQVITARGVPLLPSGYWYIHGLTFSYLEAPFVALARVLPVAPEFVWRLPSILVSLATALLLYRVGSRHFGRGTGVLAALLLTLLPESIDWGTRSRMYSLLQLLSLATVATFYRATQEQHQRSLWLLPVWFTAAMLTHLEAALLLPALVAGALVIGKGRWLLRRSSLISLGLCAVGAALPLGLERLGTAQLAGTTEGLLGVHGGLWRYLGSFDPRDLLFYAQYLLLPPRLYLTAPTLAMLVALLVRARRGPGQAPGVSPSPLPTKAFLFFCTVYAVCLIEFVLAVSWHSRDRYLHFILPLLILPAAWALWSAGASIRSALESRQPQAALATESRTYEITGAARPAAHLRPPWPGAGDGAAG